MIGRRLVAEGLGTAILVATVVGSGIMAQRLAGGNDAIALLCNTIPTGAILVVLITIFAPVSGAHFNPAVTLAFAATGDRPWREALPYIVAQCAGGILGTIVAHLMFDLAPLAIGTTARSGPSQWLAEAVATFTLLLAIFGGVRQAPQAVPWLVGLTITATYWFTSSTSFANPAVTLARGFTTTFAGIAINHVPGFIAAQLVGAAIATVVAMVLLRRMRPNLIRHRIAGEGTTRRGGGGRGLNTTQPLPSRADHKLTVRIHVTSKALHRCHRSATTTKLRSGAPSTTVRSLRELQWSSLPRCRGGGK